MATRPRYGVWSQRNQAVPHRHVEVTMVRGGGNASRAVSAGGLQTRVEGWDGGVGEECGVRSDQGAAPVDGGGDQEPVCGIAVELRAISRASVHRAPARRTAMAPRRLCDHIFARVVFSITMDRHAGRWQQT
jgi:hypothetical protein